MNIDTQLEDLENAILKRAQALVDSQHHNAEQQRAQILAEAAQRLQQLERRETAVAKSASEQTYRRRVQASEIKLQAEVDQLRWSLVQNVMQQLRQHLIQLCSDAPQYLGLLRQYLRHAAQALNVPELVVLCNARDYALLEKQWDSFIKSCEFTQSCELRASPKNFSGGFIVQSPDARMQIDNSFEGVISRQEMELYQEITAQLLATTLPTRNF